jgi:hypothetical protein
LPNHAETGDKERPRCCSNGQLTADKTPLPTHKLKLLGVLVAWLQRDEIAVAHSAGDKKRAVGIGGIIGYYCNGEGINAAWTR